MAMPKVRMNVRKVSDQVSIIDIAGDFTGAAESALMDAFTTANESGAKAIALNFTDMGYMNSSGIGLLITLLIRMNRQKERLMVYGLSEHYAQIFSLTRLDEAVSICASEVDAVREATAAAASRA